MLNVVCMKWRGENELPWQTAYTAAHVNALRHMVARHLDVPHRFICVTDDMAGIEADEVYVHSDEMWEWVSRGVPGGLYRKLWLFSFMASQLWSPRFLYLDLDVVITGDITPLVRRLEPTVLNSYKPRRPDVDQRYNTSVMLMGRGEHTKVWNSFGPDAPARIEQAHRDGVCTLTDQGWVRLVLGTDCPVFTEADGVYEAWQTEDGLPENARIVCFSGPRWPWTSELPWVREHYPMEALR